MNLFLKIFLWFLAAIALMIGVIMFLNWSVQTEPVVSRWRISVRNQTSIYAATSKQLLENEGEAGLGEFLHRIRTSETISEVDVIGDNGKSWPADAPIEELRPLTQRALASEEVEFDLTQQDTAMSARQFTAGGVRYVLIVRWERPRPAPVFGETWLRYLRFAGLLLTALLLCWLLARYLSSPIQKLREATRRLAAGSLDTRVYDQIGRRHDELASLAKDFDVMAERIETLLDSQKRLSRDVSHELRSPLARLNVALEIAKQRSTPETAGALQRIETESNRLNEMISSILTLSRLESGAVDVSRDRVDIAAVVASVAEDADFEARARSKRVEFTADGPAVIQGNERLLRSAVENVLRNAVRYTKENSAVEVALGADNGRTVIDIRDHGGGVPDEELANLFRPFYRITEARERKTGGIGLGLAIAEQAIRAHGGTISAANEGDGLVVRITLNGRRTAKG
jgi:two-component system sensor histidine kinase CpxA